MQLQDTLEYFSQICQIPRASWKESMMREFLIKRAENYAYAWKKDSYWNLVVFVPATDDKQGHETILLQAHMDMVCVQAVGIQHDFEKDPIQTTISWWWMTSKGTTLGADNGIGIALLLYAAQQPSHPPLELLFTTEEEIGLKGAIHLDRTLISAKKIINLDTEELWEICVSSAGWARINVQKTYDTTTAHYPQHCIRIEKMKWWHSGTEIHENRGNAIRLLIQIIIAAAEQLDLPLDSLEISTIQWWQAFNAIPGDCQIHIGTKDNDLFLETVKHIFQSTIGHYDAPDAFIHSTASDNNYFLEWITELMTTIVLQHDGVIAMSEKIDWLVETSNNLGVIQTNWNDFLCSFLPRSSNSQKLDNEIGRIQEAFPDATVSIENKYYGWEQDPDSELVQQCKQAYRSVLWQDAHIVAVHAWLECGVISWKLWATAEAVSFWPTIKNPHSPDETVDIASIYTVESVLSLLLTSL